MLSPPEGKHRDLIVQLCSAKCGSHVWQFKWLIIKRNFKFCVLVTLAPFQVLDGYTWQAEVQRWHRTEHPGHRHPRRKFFWKIPSQVVKLQDFSHYQPRSSSKKGAEESCVWIWAGQYYWKNLLWPVLTQDEKKVLRISKMPLSVRTGFKVHITPSFKRENHLHSISTLAPLLWKMFCKYIILYLFFSNRSHIKIFLHHSMRTDL